MLFRSARREVFRASAPIPKCATAQIPFLLCIYLPVIDSLRLWIPSYILKPNKAHRFLQLPLSLLPLFSRLLASPKDLPQNPQRSPRVRVQRQSTLVLAQRRPPASEDTPPADKPCPGSTPPHPASVLANERKREGPLSFTYQVGGNVYTVTPRSQDTCGCISACEGCSLNFAP